MDKHKSISGHNRLLFRVGIIFSLTLIFSIAVSAFHSYYLVMNEEKQEALGIAESISNGIKREDLREDTLLWFFDYWESHYDEMNYIGPEELGEIEPLEAWEKAHEKTSDLLRDDPDTLTPDYLEGLDENNQRLFAEYVYSLLWINSDSRTKYKSTEDGLKKYNIDDIQFSVYEYIGNDQVFVYFGNLKAPDTDRKSTLGQINKLTLEKHPVVSDILDSGEEPKKVEHIVVDEKGRDFLYAAWPLILEGKVKCIVGVMYPWAETKKDLTSRLYKSCERSLVYLILSEIILLIILNVMLIRPIKKLQTEIREYSKDKDSCNVEAGLVKINKRKDEIGSLSRDFTDLTNELDRYVGEIYTLAEEKAAVGAELSVATKIQAELLPCTFPPFPDRSEFEIFASMTPAKEVGGDFYDFFLLDDDHLALVMADVSEKGVPAALFMVVSRTLIKGRCQMSKNQMGSPKFILEAVNNKLYESNPEGMFVTVWLGILQISTGRIVACNAGHEYPVMRKADGVFELIKDRHGMFVGAMPDIKYTEYEIQLEKGGCLFLYTDGVPEATNADCELFGTDRMLDALNKEPGASPETLISNVKESVDDFVKDAPQFDDITMLAISLHADQETVL